MLVVDRDGTKPPPSADVAISLAVLAALPPLAAGANPADLDSPPFCLSFSLLALRLPRLRLRLTCATIRLPTDFSGFLVVLRTNATPSSSFLSLLLPGLLDDAVDDGMADGG